MRTLAWCLAWSLSVVVAPVAMAQDRGLAIEYTVKVADIPGQLFHVTTDIRNVNQPALDLSLPVWSPGWYVIENYAKNIYRFRVTEPGGRQLRPALVRKQTWRVDTEGSRASPSSSITGRSFSPPIRRASRQTTRSSPVPSLPEPYPEICLFIAPCPLSRRR